MITDKNIIAPPFFPKTITGDVILMISSLTYTEKSLKSLKVFEDVKKLFSKSSLTRGGSPLYRHYWRPGVVDRSRRKEQVKPFYWEEPYL